MSDPHDGWTPEQQVEVQPGDPWRDAQDETGLRHAIAREFTYTGPHDYRTARAIVDSQFDAADPAPAGLDVERLREAEWWHRAINEDPMLPDCSGTHSMGYGYCQRLAALATPAPAGCRTCGQPWDAEVHALAHPDHHPFFDPAWTAPAGLDETTHAILRRFWKVPDMEGSDGHRWVRRDSVSAAIQGLPDPALVPAPLTGETK